MMWWNGDWSWWGWLWMVLIWGLVIWGIVFLVRRLSPPSTPESDGRAHRATPEEILAERFARGEIDAEEFTRRSEVLRSPEKRGEETVKTTTPSDGRGRVSR